MAYRYNQFGRNAILAHYLLLQAHGSCNVTPYKCFTISNGFLHGEVHKSPQRHIQVFWDEIIKETLWSFVVVGHLGTGKWELAKCCSGRLQIIINFEMQTIRQSLGEKFLHRNTTFHSYSNVHLWIWSLISSRRELLKIS